MLTQKRSRKNTWKQAEDLGCFHETHTDDGSSLEEVSTCKAYFKEKSELCKKFMEKGECPYGYKCKFAHGSHELRQNNGQNCKYKTKECLTFFQSCHCKYGERCNFLHAHKGTLQALEMGSLNELLNSYPEIVITLKTGNHSKVVSNSLSRGF